MPKNVKKGTAKTAAVEPVPDWVTKTPGEISYDLEMYDPWSGCVDGVTITRDEYIALKQHLAKMRGFAPRKVAA